MTHGSAQDLVVRGRVVESVDSAWVAGATVHLGTHSPFFTTADGQFEFTGVSPGRQTLMVEALGFGTRVVQFRLRRDTTLIVVLDPDPLALDSLLVRSERVTVRGTVRDAESGRRVPKPQVFLRPGFQTMASSAGTFRFRGVPSDREYWLEVEAPGYRPAAIEVTTDGDKDFHITLEADPVAERMMEIQVDHLESRSRRVAMSRRIMDRDALTEAPFRNLYDFLRYRVGRRGRFKVDCLFIDETREFDTSVLQFFKTGDIQRVEVYGTSKIARIYTRRYMAGKVGRQPTYRPILYMPGTNYPICH